MPRRALALLVAVPALAAPAAVAATPTSLPSEPVAAAQPASQLHLGPAQTPAPTSAEGAADRARVIRYRTTDPQNVDIDLGEPGPGPGDQQLFLDRVVRGKKTIGTNVGQAIVFVLREDRLVVQLTATVTLPAGTLTTQGVIDENPARGPEPLRLAVTGGTGRYAGASGEAFGRYVGDRGTIRWRVELH